MSAKLLQPFDLHAGNGGTPRKDQEKFEGGELDVLAGDEVAAGGFGVAEGGVALMEAVVEVAPLAVGEGWALQRVPLVLIWRQSVYCTVRPRVRPGCLSVVIDALATANSRLKRATALLYGLQLASNNARGLRTEALPSAPSDSPLQRLTPGITPPYRPQNHPKPALTPPPEHGTLIKFGAVAPVSLSQGLQGLAAGPSTHSARPVRFNAPCSTIYWKKAVSALPRHA